MSIGMNMVAKIGILPETSKYSSEKFCKWNELLSDASVGQLVLR
jgi:hypothetical protein